MHNNELYWRQQINNQADALTNQLSPLLAITNKIYNEIGLSNNLGEVQEFHTLGDLSDILNLPIPIIEEEYFYKRSNVDHLLHPMTKAEKDKIILQRDKFRLIFKTIVDNIMTIIQRDSS